MNALTAVLAFLNALLTLFSQTQMFPKKRNIGLSATLSNLSTLKSQKAIHQCLPIEGKSSTWLSRGCEPMFMKV
tara:strand:+ start:4220 stop:4441 length:222 start_codon:yes stop_codon:yes gene_type:complete